MDMNTEENLTECDMGGSSRAIVLVNSDLKMSPGLMAAQVAHVILKMSKDIEADCMLPAFPTQRFLEYQTWLERDVIVVKKATESELRGLAKELPVGTYCMFEDTGTLIGPTARLTCMVCYPGMVDSERVKKFGLA
jgi:peptidyl-tRNA hydrolase